MHVTSHEREVRILYYPSLYKPRSGPEVKVLHPVDDVLSTYRSIPQYRVVRSVGHQLEETGGIPRNTNEKYRDKTVEFSFGDVIPNAIAGACGQRGKHANGNIKSYRRRHPGNLGQQSY